MDLFLLKDTVWIIQEIPNTKHTAILSASWQKQKMYRHMWNQKKKIDAQIHTTDKKGIRIIACNGQWHMSMGV